MLGCAADILEYCVQTELLTKKQYYLDLLSPKYNILSYAYSLLGYKHNEKTIEKLKSKVISAEHKKLLSDTHKNKIVIQETKNKLSVATSNYKKNNPLTLERLANIKIKTITREGVAVSVLNTKTD